MSPRLARCLWQTLIAAGLLAGCVRQALPPALPFNVSTLDTSALRGKTIIIDPGHGGPERGAIAQNGLSEAEVNLGVALYLWGFLNEAGACPVLTRSSDTPVYTGERFALRSDLEARAALGASRKADLFVSIHHNSDGRASGKRNDLCIYYKLSDPDRSRDVARDVCAALRERLNAEPATIQPGNYLVLRASAPPAILGEASYMNYKRNGEKLAYHRTLAAEAQGYFLGILSYYSKGVPVISFIEPPKAVAAAQPELAAKIVGGAPGAAIDPASLRCRIDGREAPRPSFDQAGSVTCAPAAALPNGAHQLCLSARNIAGNAAAATCTDFMVSLPPARMTVRPVFATIPADGQTEAPVDIDVFDSLGRPVIDGTKISLSVSAGRLRDAEAATMNGRARAYIIAAAEPRRARCQARVEGISGSAEIAFGNTGQALLAVAVKDAAGRPVEGAALARDSHAAIASDRSGTAYDSGPAGSAQYEVRKKGYDPARIRIAMIPGKLARASCVLRPVDGGVFFGRTVALDAADGTPAVSDMLGALKQRIEYAGGSAPLAGDLPVQDRVALAADAHADVFVSLAGGRNPAAHYYYKSAQGERLAGLVCESLIRAAAFCKRCKAETGTEYVLLHTPMPALLLLVPSKMKIPPDSAAQSLYRALLDYFSR